MKKGLLIVLLLAALATTMIGCSSGKSQGETSTKPSAEETNETISSEKNLFNVEVTLPSSFFEDEDFASIETNAKSQGIHDVKLNDDGSVTYKMNKSTHKKLLDDLKVNIDESIASTLADKETFPSFTKITYNDSVTEFNILVDSSLFNSFESFAALGFYMTGDIYQAMDCVSLEDINTTVNFIDKDSGDIIESGNSSELENTED